MKTIGEMLSLRLLTPDRHRAIDAWLAHAPTPEAVMQMPAPLWRALELASVLMNFDADLMQPPRFSEDFGVSSRPATRSRAWGRSATDPRPPVAGS